MTTSVCPSGWECQAVRAPASKRTVAPPAFPGGCAWKGVLMRTTRSISLTEEGQQLLEATQPALAMLERAIQRVRTTKDEIAGPLHIAAPRSGFTPVLWPVVDAFCNLPPEIQPDLHLDDQVSNWVTERADVGFSGSARRPGKD